MVTPLVDFKEPPELLDITSAPPVFTVVRARDQIVHPATRALQRAIALDPSESPDCLRQLCLALRDAAGNFALPAADDPDRSRRPLMKAELAVAALLRFAELRHGPGDNLTEGDLAGKCFTGLTRLMKCLKVYEDDVMDALSTRVGHAIKVIHAFSDLPRIFKRNKNLVRLIIERFTPEILASKYPLPDLVKALEPYGFVQMRFLYLATMGGAIKARLDEFNREELLEIVWRWKVRAREPTSWKVKLRIIQDNEVRTVLRTVVGLVPLSGPRLTDWAREMVWASWLAPEQNNVRLPLLDYTLRTGVLERKDPAEIYHLSGLIDEAARYSELQGIDLVMLVARYLSEAFDAASVHRVSHVLENLDISYMSRAHYRFIEVLAQASGSFVLRSTGDMLEELLATWASRHHNEKNPVATLWACVQAVRTSLVGCMAERPPGAVARSSAHLSYIGVRHWDMQPILDYLLDRNIVAPDIGLAFALLGDLWARPGERVPRLTRVEMILRLVGVPDEIPRKADIAASGLTTRMAVQLPTLQHQIEAAVDKWRFEEHIRLPAVIAPFVLQAASPEHVAAIDVELGDLARSAVLLYDAAEGLGLNVRQCEWALLPFAFANKEDIHTAVGRVTYACESDGMPAPVLNPACLTWLDAGGPLMKLPKRVAEAALDVWQEADVRGAGLGYLLRTHEWLVAQDKSGLLSVDAAWAVHDVRVLLSSIRGDVVTLDVLNRARHGLLSRLLPSGEDALAEAVALVWSREIPGLSLDTAYMHFTEWWHGQDARTVCEDLTDNVVTDLMWRTNQRLLATFKTETVLGGMSPSWRIEGNIKVPWFVPKEAVMEAYAQKKESDPEPEPPRYGEELSKSARYAFHAELEATRAAQKTRHVSIRWDALVNKTLNGRPKNGRPRREPRPEQVVRLENRRCMYCGSATNVYYHTVFPYKLGGAQMSSNSAAVCHVCKDFSERIGSKRWGELLAAAPSEAAEAWWQSQREADERAMDKLKMIAPIPSTAPQLPEVASSTRAP